MLTIEELVKLLRDMVNVQNAESETVDPAFLSMTDEQLTLYLKLAASKMYPDIDSLDELPSGSEYVLMLIAKIDLYSKLAVLKANFVDMGADNNNYLKQSQRFDHYMKLLDGARKEYNDWIEDGGISSATGVSSFRVLRDKNHYSLENYEYGISPSVRIRIKLITNDSIDFSWVASNTTFFGRYKVYVSTEPIYDTYAEIKGFDVLESRINSTAKLIKSTNNMKDTFHRITGLLPDTEYHLAVFCVERNHLYGFKETTFSTLPPFDDNEEEVNDETIGG